MVWTIGTVVGAVLLIGIGLFNMLVVRRNAVKNAFSSVDALLKKRYDLIPNLVAVVRGYAQHERNLLEEVSLLRAQATAGKLPPEETLALNARLGGLLGSMRLVAESYPELKAGRNFLQLQAALNEVEEQISAGRRAYNAAVTALNNAVEMFPMNLVAACTGFHAAPFFEAPAEERAGPAATPAKVR